MNLSEMDWKEPAVVETQEKFEEGGQQVAPAHQRAKHIVEQQTEKVCYFYTTLFQHHYIVYNTL